MAESALHSDCFSNPCSSLFSLKTGCILKPCAAAALWPISGDSRYGGVGLHVDVVRATNERYEGGPECYQGAAAGVDIVCSSRIWGAVCAALVWGVRLKTCSKTNAGPNFEL